MPGKMAIGEMAIGEIRKNARGLPLGIFGGGMLLASPNPDPISDQKMPFPAPVFRPGLKKYIPVFRRDLVHD